MRTGTAFHCYSSVTNKLLEEASNEGLHELNDSTGEGQDGFTRNHSPVDKLFTQIAFMQNQFFFNRKLFVAFTDFEKAFDSLDRTLVLPILKENGIQIGNS